MKRRLGSLIAATALALSTLVVPATALADGVGFPYFGGLLGGAPLLPCTGFMQIVAQVPAGYDDKGKPILNDDGTVKTVTSTFSAVDGDAIKGLRQCTSLCDLFTLANNLMIFALSIIIVIILPVMIMVGAGYIITGGGNPGQRAQGINIIRGTLIAIALFVFGFFIVNQMLQLVFDQAYGDALRERAKNQPDTKLTPEQIDNLFSWDNLSCTPNAGGVKITPTPQTDTTGGGTTGGGNTNTTKDQTNTTNPNTGDAPPNTCATDATRSTRTCKLGWVTPPAGICPPSNPHMCAYQVAPTGLVCTTDAKIAAGAALCIGKWAENSQCPANHKVCVNTATNIAPPGSCHTDADVGATVSCERGWRKVDDSLCLSERPNFCREMAEANRCYAAEAVQQGAYVCSSSWREDLVRCPRTQGPNFAVQEFRVCGGTANTPPIITPTETTRTYCESIGGTCRPGSTTRAQCGNALSEPNQMGCTSGKRCCYSDDIIINPL